MTPTEKSGSGVSTKSTTVRKFFLRRKNSLVWAWTGLRIFFTTETHAVLHLIAAGMVLILGWLFSVTTSEWLALVLAIALVVQAEIWNTVLEKMADYIQPEIDPRIKVIKDLSASGVLCCALAALVIGLLVFVPYVLEWM